MLKYSIYMPSNFLLNSDIYLRNLTKFSTNCLTPEEESLGMGRDRDQIATESEQRVIWSNFAIRLVIIRITMKKFQSLGKNA